MQPYLRDTRKNRRIPHDVLAWHPMTCLGHQLTVVDVGKDLYDTAFVFPALQASTPLPLKREGMTEIFYVPRELYFPVHQYPARRR